MNEEKNCWIYIRVSTEDQAREGFSLPEQEKRLRATSKLNKNNFTITNKEGEEIKDYIKQTTDTTFNLKFTNDLTTILEKYEKDLKNHSNEVKNLQKKIKIKDEKIENLQYNLKNANDTVVELKIKFLNYKRY